MENTYELFILGTGTVGLLGALLWLIFRKKPSAKSIHITAKSAKPEHPSTSTLASDAASQSPQQTWWTALAKTRDRFALKVSASNQELREALEEACIVSDLGVSNTDEALEKISWTQLDNQTQPKEEQAKKMLCQTLKSWLPPVPGEDLKSWPKPLPGSPKVLWFVGVNGVGKTTSIAKVAAELKNRGHSVILAAGDTFRAAASEQLETWAQRLGIECIRGQQGSDSSSVLFNALDAAKARKIDFVLADSAGRLHNQSQLMEALEKNRRVMDKALPGAPHEVLLVLDANTGQNMLSQAETFLKAVGVTGLILTKLDGSAKGGAVVAVSRKTGLPIYRLGLGEQPEDFRPFEADAFCEALLGLR